MAERTLVGLALKVGPLGEHDRLLSLLSDAEGVSRLAVPGARRPKSSLAAAAPLTLLELQVGGRSGLARVRQLRVLHSHAGLGRQLETLSAAQAFCDLCLQMGREDPVEGLLATLQLHLERLDQRSDCLDELLASSVQGAIHLLTLGGYSLPLQSCCLSGAPLEPPIGTWEWRCSLLPMDGFAIDRQPGAAMTLNPSELALLQRLTRADLPRRRDGELMGPRPVWLRLLAVVEIWIRTHLQRGNPALAMLRECITATQVSQHGADALNS